MSNHARNVSLVLLSGLLIGNQTAFSWGNDGHELVARIAAKHLTKKTLAAVAALLRNDSQVSLPANPTPLEVEDAMATVSTWPDHINKHATGTEEWHFIDIGLLENQSAIAQRCGNDGNCVVDKITQLQANLRASADLGVFQPFEELKFLIHFVGDIHQPLHTATNDDAGGNCLATRGLGENELHAVWDTGLVNVIRRGPAGGSSAHNLLPNSTVAVRLNQAITPANRSTWRGVVEPRAIAMESHQLAVDQVYGLLVPAVGKRPGFNPAIRPVSCQGIPPQLQTTVWQVAGIFQGPSDDLVRTQISKAGIRLAQILNGIFDPGGVMP